MHGYLSEGRRWLERGLAQSDGASASARAKALNEAGWIAVFQGDERATALLEEGLSLFRELDDKAGVAASLGTLGVTMVHHQGDRGRLAVLREEAEALRREPLDRGSVVLLLYFLALAALVEGDYGRSTVLTEEGLALSRELEDTRNIIIFLIILGMISLRQEDHERAAALFEEDLHLLPKLGDKVSSAYCLLGLAGATALAGRPARAARLWGALEALQEAAGIVVAVSPLVRSWYDYEGRLASARSQLDEMAWKAVWSEGRAMTLEGAIEYALLAKEEPTTTSSAPTALPAGLSVREAEVLKLVAEGLTNVRIAEGLFISPRTVDRHLNSIYGKLRVGSRAAATRFAIEHGLA